MRGRQLIVVVLLAGLVLAASATPALAAHPTAAGHVPFALLGIDFPSVRSIVHDVIKFFFSTLLDALVPDWLKHAAVAVVKRLVTVPNPADARTWPTLAKLSQGMRWIAIPLLSLAAVAGWMQQWVRELTGRPSSLESVLARTVLAAVLLVVYPVFLGQAVALVNSITNAMLSLPAVGDGLARTVGLVFAGTLLSGSEVLLALLGIAAVVLGVGLFMLDVGLLVIFALLFVSAPLAIVCSVVDETRGIWRAWRFALLSAAMVPVGWCILFATAGAFMLDMTRWSGGIAGTLGARFVGIFGAILILWLAVRWPLMLWSTIRTHIGGALGSAGSRGGATAAASTGGGRAARAALARTSMGAAARLSGGLGMARSYAGTSARMALGDGARLAGRLPGAQAVAGAAGRLSAPVSAALAPAAAAVAPVVAGTQQIAAAARGRASAAGDAGKRALRGGASTREAAQAAAAGLARPTPRPAAETSPSGLGTGRERDRSRTGAAPTNSVAAGSAETGSRDARSSTRSSRARVPSAGRNPIGSVQPAADLGVRGASAPARPSPQPTGAGRPQPAAPTPTPSSPAAPDGAPARPVPARPVSPTERSGSTPLKKKRR